jgi:antitoxin component YwqK of YwqJK toxin-antitoxin module
MQKGYLTFIFLYLFSFAQQEDYVRDTAIYDSVRKITQKGKMVNYSREGLWVYDSAGIKISEAEYCYDYQSGNWKEYYKNGTLCLDVQSVLLNSFDDSTYKIITNRNEFEHKGFLLSRNCGKWNEYYDNGQLKESGKYELKKPFKLTQFKSNELSVFSDTSITDTVTEEHIWSVRSGTWTTYYSNGQIKSVGEYYPAEMLVDSILIVNDTMGNSKMQMCASPFYFKDGYWKYFSENGKLIREEWYDKTKLVAKVNYSE